jgi:hypothetical protein
MSPGQSPEDTQERLPLLQGTQRTLRQHATRKTQTRNPATTRWQKKQQQELVLAVSKPSLHEGGYFVHRWIEGGAIVALASLLRRRGKRSNGKHVKRIDGTWGTAPEDVLRLLRPQSVHQVPLAASGSLHLISVMASKSSFASRERTK